MQAGNKLGVLQWVYASLYRHFLHCNCLTEGKDGEGNRNRREKKKEQVLANICVAEKKIRVLVENRS